MTQYAFDFEDEQWMHDPRFDTPLDMVREYAFLSKQKGTPELYKRLIYEEHSEWEEAQYLGTGDEELKELADLVYVIYGYANVRGWDLDEAVRRVHSNNVERIFQPDGTIKRREDGKIIKNPNAPKIGLGDLV